MLQLLADTLQIIQNHWILSLLVLLATLTCVHYLASFSEIQRIGLPGLKPLPILGNVVQTLWDRGQMHKTFDRFVKQYGKVFGIYLLKTPAIVVTDPQMLKTILVKEFNSFHDKPVSFCLSNVNIRLSLGPFLNLRSPQVHVNWTGEGCLGRPQNHSAHFVRVCWLSLSTQILAQFYANQITLSVTRNKEKNTKTIGKTITSMRMLMKFGAKLFCLCYNICLERSSELGNSSNYRQFNEEKIATICFHGLPQILCLSS